MLFLLVLALDILKKMNVFCNHNWIVVTSKIENGDWCQSYNGKKISGSDYKRIQFIANFKCSKCGNTKYFSDFEDNDPNSKYIALIKLNERG